MKKIKLPLVKTRKRAKTKSQTIKISKGKNKMEKSQNVLKSNAKSQKSFKSKLRIVKKRKKLKWNKAKNAKSKKEGLYLNVSNWKVNKKRLHSTVEVPKQHTSHYN